MKKTIFLLVLLMAMGVLFATTLNESFESPTFPPPGWGIVNGGDGRTWQRTYMENTGHTGYGCATIETSNIYVHDDWLITPQLTPMSGSSTFSFWARTLFINSYYPAEQFNVKLSISTNDISAMTYVLASNVTTSTSYAQYSYDLSPYIGQNVHVAIQALYADRSTLMVDDIIGPQMMGFEGFETGNFNSFAWNNASASPWTLQNINRYSGIYAAKSGVISDGASTSLSITQYISEIGHIYFLQMVSSESGSDFLKFYIDDVEQGSWSGEGLWQAQSYLVYMGTHTFRWTYSKNGSGSSGSDCAWIDHIVFPPSLVGTAADPYQITTAAELNNIRNYLGSSFSNKRFKLMNDIDLTAYLAPGGAGYSAWGTNGWLSIGNGSSLFYGSFDGNNHTISNLSTHYYGTCHGLFGANAVGSTIQNLTMSNTCYILGDGETGSIIGRNNGVVLNCRSAATINIGNADKGGGIVGNNYGVIGNCGFSGTITRSGSGVSCNKIGGIAGNSETGAIINNSYSTGSISGNTYTAGLVGWNNGTINNCYTTGTVTGAANADGGLVGQNQGVINNSYSRATVSGASYVGGLVGYNSGSTITNCFSTGAVTGSIKGGLCGQTGATINSSYWDTQTSGLATSYGGTGKTTAEMKTQSNFSGWDFAGETANGTNDYWYMTSTDNAGYPFLCWEKASEVRAPLLVYPGDAASGISQNGFNFSWTPFPGGQTPDHYNLYFIKGNPSHIFEAGYTDQHSYLNLHAISYNPVSSGVISLHYGEVWYWTVIAYTSNGEAFPTPTTRSFTIENEVVFTDGFETGNTQGSTTISNWTQALGSGTNYWTVNSTNTDFNRTPKTGSFNVTLFFPGNAWMFRSVVLKGGVPYRVELYARQDGTVSSNASVGISYGTAATIAGMTNVLVTQTGLVNGSYQLITATFVPQSNGTYYIGINGIIATPSNYISMDDITLKHTPLIAPVAVTQNLPADMAINQILLPTINWTFAVSGGFPSSYKIYCQASNRPITPTALVATVTSPTFTFTTSLEYNSTYYWMVIASNAYGDATGNMVHSFTTIQNPELPQPQPNDLSARSISGTDYGIIGTPIAHTITVTNYGSSSQDSYTVRIKSVSPAMTLATLNVTIPLASGETTSHSITWTPTNASLHVSKIYGEVVLNSDSLLANNITSNIPFGIISGSGTDTDPYGISTPEALNAVRYFLGVAYAGKHFKLLNDIDLAAYLITGNGFAAWGSSGWLPIGSGAERFYGSFDGNNRTISGFVLDRAWTDNCGLFGYTEFGSRIESTKLVGHPDRWCNAANSFGMLVGGNNGTISNCSAQFSRIVSQSWSGGLVGTNNGTISKCFTSGNVESYWELWASSIGGLVGINYGNIGNCYSRASVKAYMYMGGLVGIQSGTITNCYATGAIDHILGDNSRGGILGAAGGTVVNSYWDKQTTGILTSFGSDSSFGKSTAMMKMQGTYAGWDFTNTWFIDPSVNDGYPQLAWAATSALMSIPTNITIQKDTVLGVVTITWDDMHAAWYGVYAGSSPSNLTYLGWTGTNSITVNADNHGFFKITSGSGTPTAPALLRGNYELRIKN